MRYERAEGASDRPLDRFSLGDGMWISASAFRWFLGEKGATAVEYAFVAALIAVVVIGSVRLIGVATQDNLCSPSDGLANVGAENIDGCQ